MKTDIPWFNSYLIYDGRGTELRLLSSQPVKGPADKAHGIPAREIVVPEPDLNKEDAMTDEKKPPRKKSRRRRQTKSKPPLAKSAETQRSLPLRSSTTTARLSRLRDSSSLRNVGTKRSFARNGPQ